MSFKDFALSGQQGDNALTRLALCFEAADPNSLISIWGSVAELTASHVRVAGLSKFTKLGDWVSVETDSGDQIGEAIRIETESILVRPLEDMHRPAIGARARLAQAIELRPDSTWKGRVIDALARPVDGGPPLVRGPRAMPLDRPPPSAFHRERVSEPVFTGVRSIDLFTPLCAGQRIGIFAGSGVGKSTLLSMLSRGNRFDTTVFAAIGERGREVKEFIEDTLGEGIGKAIVVVSTSDESPMMRRLAAKTALGVAEYFRDEGERVLLIFDSITRYAQAAREIALASGEPPVSRGFPPSVFTGLPKLLERAGCDQGAGSITGVFAVLVEGDDHNDPVADTLRGILDGHIVLDRGIADQGRFPAIDILGSVSRLAIRVWTPEQRAAVTQLKALIAKFEETRDIRLIGGYKPNADPELDRAMQLVPALYRFISQGPGDVRHDETIDGMLRSLAS
ncbi:MAG: FliI/YscN family ATPase [Rhodomicrobium sp.]|jgi:flagellum-specific ATP synthase